MTTTPQFGARLKELREAAGLTQKALADASGLNRVTLAHYERGQPADLKVSTLEKLAAALGVPLFALFMPPGTGAMTPKKIRDFLSDQG